MLHGVMIVGCVLCMCMCVCQRVRMWDARMQHQQRRVAVTAEFEGGGCIGRIHGKRADDGGVQMMQGAGILNTTLREGGVGKSQARVDISSEPGLVVRSRRECPRMGQHSDHANVPL
jgi:hypothetical protein